MYKPNIQVQVHTDTNLCFYLYFRIMSSWYSFILSWGPGLVSNQLVLILKKVACIPNYPLILQPTTFPSLSVRCINSGGVANTKQQRPSLCPVHLAAAGGVCPTMMGNIKMVASGRGSRWLMSSSRFQYGCVVLVVVKIVSRMIDVLQQAR